MAKSGVPKCAEPKNNIAFKLCSNFKLFICELDEKILILNGQGDILLIPHTLLLCGNDQGHLVRITENVDMI
jgi:hypothetical protein